MTIGRNTEAGRELEGYVERIEKIRVEKKDLGAFEAAIMAEAKSRGYVPKAIRAIVKRRAMKPHDREESDTLITTYEHAMGLSTEAPLHRQVGLMKVDTASRGEVIAALKMLVPDNGAITVECGGVPIRLIRDASGEVREVDGFQPGQAADAPPTVTGDAYAPNITPDQAEDLGRAAYRENTAITANPFPFGDPRRPRWDAGWRKESGGDGMGPSEG